MQWTRATGASIQAIMTTARKLLPPTMTVADFLDRPGDGTAKRFQLVDGEPSAMAPGSATARHHPGDADHTDRATLGRERQRMPSRRRVGHRAAPPRDSQPACSRHRRDLLAGPAGTDRTARTRSRHRSPVTRQRRRYAKQRAGPSRPFPACRRSLSFTRHGSPPSCCAAARISPGPSFPKRSSAATRLGWTASISARRSADLYAGTHLA